jgi:hypothetical protein
VAGERPRNYWSHIFEVVAFLFTLGASVASLGHLTEGNGQLVLRGIAVVSVTYGVLLFSTGYLLANEHIRLRGEVAVDIVDIVSRQSSRNEEHVSVEIIVGRRDSEDMVKEMVEVRPDPQVVHRLVRPIMPNHWRMPRRLAEIDFRCTVDDGVEGPVVVAKRLVRAADYLLIWLIFRPTMTVPTTWRFQYRPKGLWRELRKSDHDLLVWHDTLSTDRRSPMVDFRIRFLFLDPEYKPRVAEHRDLGKTTPATRLATGEWEVTWQDSNPEGRRYEWTITRAPQGNGKQRSHRFRGRWDSTDTTSEPLHTWTPGRPQKGEEPHDA